MSTDDACGTAEAGLALGQSAEVDEGDIQQRVRLIYIVQAARLMIPQVLLTSQEHFQQHQAVLLLHRNVYHAAVCVRLPTYLRLYSQQHLPGTCCKPSRSQYL